MIITIMPLGGLYVVGEYAQGSFGSWYYPTWHAFLTSAIITQVPGVIEHIFVSVHA